jgi:regulator of protease activity HflC (stomatin/prohibitin superfamily)
VQLLFLNGPLFFYEWLSICRSRVQLDSERWGVQITRVEIFNILPPRDIAQAMERQIKAERNRRAKVLHADGTRESAVIRSRGEAAQILNAAEAERTGTVARAKGTAEAKRVQARAQATAVRHIRGALGDSGYKAVDYLAAVTYLTTLGRVSSGGRAIMLPWTTVNMADEIMGSRGPKPIVG